MTNFKIKIKIIFFFITICNSAIYSQEGSVLIKKDSTLIKIIELRNEVNSEIYDKNFYSIQLYYGNLDTANKLAKDFSKDFSEWETQIIFETPNYKLRVGKFKKILEAQKELEKIKKIYTSAFILMPNNL